MIYALYHVVIDTHMDENGLPRWVDVLGGLLDVATVAGVLYTIASLP